VCKLKYTENDYWVTEAPIITNLYYFQYKYVVWDNNANKMVTWERGIDRLIDCEILDNFAGKATLFDFQFAVRNGKNSHCVILDEIFEKFQAIFSVNMPNPDLQDDMKIMGNNNIQEQMMVMEPNKTEWMPSKYGEPWKPYIIKIWIDNIVSGVDGKFDKGENEVIEYEYVHVNNKKETSHSERKPRRQFLIENPHYYKGQLGATGSTLWSNAEKVFVVNGFVNKADGNFELNFRYQ
jgi:hypothetical protein